MPTDFGTDINGTSDLDPACGTVSGTAALGQALARRLETPRGALWYDADYGTDVRGRLNDALRGGSALHALQADIEAECEKDKRVRRASATLIFTASSSALSVTIRCELASGPFTFVLSADALTVALLKTL